MQMNSNVIELKQSEGYEDILFFLNGLETKSTKDRYRACLKRFFKKLYKTELEHVTPDMINKLTYTDMKKYRDSIRRKYKASTTNNEIIAIISYLREITKIQRNGKYVYHINVDQLKPKMLREIDTESSGDITWQEVTDWIEYTRSSGIANKHCKAAFLELARTTGLRKEGLAQLKYKDLVQSDGIWQLKSTLKGKTKHVSISEEVCDLILSLWEDEGNKEEKILKMSTKTMERFFADLLERMNVDEERNVTIHSLRGLSIWEAYISSNDIIATMEHANHSKLDTTYNYIKNRSHKTNQPSLYMGKDFSGEEMNLSVEQFQELFNQMSRGSQYEMINKAKELGYLK